MKRILKILWQLPQAILGALVFLFVKKIGTAKWYGYIYVDITKGWGLSLYPFIFLNGNLWSDSWWHEVGHCKQSEILGPLYLLVVGIPSFVRAAIWTFDKSRKHEDYYKGFPENWADMLGGVKRG